MNRVNAMTWATYGLLVALVGGLLGAVFFAVTRVDALRDRMDARFDRVDDRFARIDERFDRVDARFARVDDQLDGVRRDIGDLDQRLTRAGG